MDKFYPTLATNAGSLWTELPSGQLGRTTPAAHGRDTVDIRKKVTMPTEKKALPGIDFKALSARVSAATKRG
jgi:hypothetical protein